MMIKKLYNPWYITNPGERETDKQLSLSNNSEECIYVIHQLRISSRFHRTQMAGECDFLLITKWGVMVIEVKGGVIGFGKADDGNHGYYRFTNGRSKEFFKDPFIQVDGNADAIKTYLRVKKLSDVFVGSMVCFPECVMEKQAFGSGYLWHRGHDELLLEMIMESLEQQMAEFHDKEIGRGKANPRVWKLLTEPDIQSLCDALKPEFDPSTVLSKIKLNLSEADRRVIEGIHVLQGLNGNRNLIVQGPPGSGKSSYALDLITRLCNKEGRKGLYICWNELLASSMQSKLNDPDKGVSPDKIKVLPYFDLAVQLAKISGNPAFMPSYEKVAVGEMKQQIKGALSQLHKSKLLEKYDFIVADEAQDLFDKGLDHIIKSLLKVNNPLQNGEYYIFFDDKQAYPDVKDLDSYIRTRDTFKACAASYTLFSNLRSNTGHGIDKFILMTGSGEFDATENFGEDVVIKYWKDPEHAISIIKECIRQEQTFGKFKSKELSVLFTADFLKNSSPFRLLLDSDDTLELLTKENLAEPSYKVIYTSILKAKGLEWDVVFLVCSGKEDQKSIFQLFIGASRAKVKLVVLAPTCYNSDMVDQS